MDSNKEQQTKSFILSKNALDIIKLAMDYSIEVCDTDDLHLFIDVRKKVHELCKIEQSKKQV